MAAEREVTGADDPPQLAGLDDGGVWLTSGARGIGTASLLADAGHEIPTALLPSLLTSTLGAPASALGLIKGVSDGLAGLARLGGGALADDPERRRAVAVGGYTTITKPGALQSKRSKTSSETCLRLPSSSGIGSPSRQRASPRIGGSPRTKQPSARSSPTSSTPASPEAWP